MQQPKGLGIKLKIATRKYAFIFQMYLPCSNYSTSYNEHCVETVENVVCSYSAQGSVFLLGDFNSELPGKNCNIANFSLDMRGRILSNLLSEFDLIPVNCLPLCFGAEFTNVPYSYGRETLIDYICVEEINIQNVF